MRTRVFNFATLMAVCVLLVAIASAAPAQDWSSFMPATCTGITLTPSFASGVTTYTLCLFNGATVNGQPINWIQAFYAVGGTSTTTFTATDNTNSLGWTFDFKQNSTGEIAGWKGLGSNRLNTPTTPGASVCGTFQYGTFTIPAGSTVIPGFHMGFDDDQSGFFKCEVPAVPECPAPLLAFGASLLSAIPILRNKLRLS